MPKNIKKKIIFIIPLLSILDQNAKVIREYLENKDLVLEHHSNVIQEKMRETLDEYEVMMENWDAPVIVSTLVQLQNILFGDRTSAIGRMQALCDSVIVIDEVQSVPSKTIEMFSMALNFLNHYCNATILLSSATQPCFEHLDYALQLNEPADLVHLTPRQKEVFIRSECIDCVTPDGMDLEECAMFCADLTEKSDSLLLICNTKSEARNLYIHMQRLADDRPWLVFHLSTAMCQKNRMDVMKEVQKKLIQVQNQQTHKKIICISTQLVEAGVDFSFQTVVRVLAGIDNLAQALGRCNRSNEYGTLGRVYFIRLKNENLSMLKEIYQSQKSTERILAENKNNLQLVFDGDSINRFYQYLFHERGNACKYPIEDGVYMAKLLANVNPYYEGGEKNSSYIMRQPFKTVAQKFRVFDDDMIDIVVPYGEGERWIEAMREIHENNCRLKYGLTKEMLQNMKPYIISVFRYQWKILDEYGMIEHLFEDRIFILKKEVYHEDYGLVEIKEPKVEEFIF